MRVCAVFRPTLGASDRGLSEGGVHKEVLSNFRSSWISCEGLRLCISVRTHVLPIRLAAVAPCHLLGLTRRYLTLVPAPCAFSSAPAARIRQKIMFRFVVLALFLLNMAAAFNSAPSMIGQSRVAAASAPLAVAPMPRAAPGAIVMSEEHEVLYESKQPFFPFLRQMQLLLCSYRRRHPRRCSR